MDKHGTVSIWFGNIKNQEALDRYVHLTYDDDGDSVPSRFFLEFDININEVDEDFIEKTVLENHSNDLSTLLEGCSYEEIIIPEMRKILRIKHHYNSSIMIYNFEYEETVKTVGSFDYITSTSYLK
ncbi:immunity 22 family protein [Bacillus aquiflavi]|uniref:Immunity 22 family protein n=1 Tax=Bacillus aquiflavi TaxID=2672567 RepID=A0A6B3VTX9_9BACI|nr:immunity 22 family protein [Bacillus aquiflavi]MBA4536290.1 immunity 22 family protein [Bacillus aquiflavi]NEY80658.1 immunity 22 family protein [Bacillus aquiflavi]UAC49467.1 immunity 22 family protein [Bacillus aquiflavi]